MALSAGLGRAGTPPESLNVSATVTFDRVGDGFKVVSSALEVRGKVPEIRRGRFSESRRGRQGRLPDLPGAQGQRRAERQSHPGEVSRASSLASSRWSPAVDEASAARSRSSSPAAGRTCSSTTSATRTPPSSAATEIARPLGVSAETLRGNVADEQASRSCSPTFATVRLPRHPDQQLRVRRQPAGHRADRAPLGLDAQRQRPRRLAVRPRRPCR